MVDSTPSPSDAFVQKRAQLAGMTTMGIGGWADVYSIESEDILPELAAKPHRFLGKGANLLVGDEDLEEPVYVLGRHFKRCELSEENGHAQVLVGGAFDLAVLVGRMAKAGWAGLEGLAGVPASIGGALRMNAGNTSLDA